MMLRNPSSDPGLVALSTVTYRLLLAFYPARFRQEYANPMMQVFRDRCLAKFHQDGLFGMVFLWVETLLDWFKTVIEEQFNGEMNMTKEKFIRLSGWGMILAAISVLLTFLPEADEILHGFYISFGAPSSLDQHLRYQSITEIIRNLPIPVAILLITVGLAGLDMRYGAQTGKGARLALRIGMLGGAAGIFLHALMLSGDADGRVSVNIAMAVMFTGLFAFGLFALRTRPMRRGNALPLLAGLWWPLLVIIVYGFPRFIETIWISEVFYGVSLSVFLAMAVFLSLLGFQLQADPLQD